MLKKLLDKTFKHSSVYIVRYNLVSSWTPIADYIQPTLSSQYDVYYASL